MEWNQLSVTDRAAIIRQMVKAGITKPEDQKKTYTEAIRKSIKPYVGVSPQIEVQPINVDNGVTLYPSVRETSLGINYDRNRMSVGAGLSVGASGGKWQYGPYTGKLEPQMNVTPYMTGRMNFGNPNNQFSIGSSWDFQHTPSINLGFSKSFKEGGHLFDGDPSFRERYANRRESTNVVDLRDLPPVTYSPATEALLSLPALWVGAMFGEENIPNFLKTQKMENVDEAHRRTQKINPNAVFPGYFPGEMRGSFNFTNEK